ncbi:MAG: hypothetical protein ACPG6B_04375, partial [Oceanihabitans sp.]
MKNTLITLLIFFITTITFSQNSQTFKPKKQFYIYGDAVCVGNNILRMHAKEAFNKVNVVNDEVKMKYVDIDNNTSTFSSSAATLELPKTTKKIVYAALYWSAIYSYEKGVKKLKGDKIVYRGNHKRVDNFNNILFKTPGEAYQEIKGDIVFDGFYKPDFEDSAPYVCYADVTKHFKTNNYNGSYMVANVKATQGYISGGSSAGWFLYVVYESDTKTPKYINTYDGLVFLNKQVLDVPLTNFETINTGEVKASLTIAALEGDSRLKRDQCFILNPQDNSYLPIYNNQRNAKNFFNSTITDDDSSFVSRTPNSSNTLGFDLVQINIPNPNNSIISNHAT